MNPVAKFISTLFGSRTQAHIFHLQSTSYAQHKALQKYYEDIIDLIDDYVEVYQGRYGILVGYQATTQLFEGEDPLLKYFMSLQRMVDDVYLQLPEDTDLRNIADEIKSLISKTIYKLQFLG